jgi:hypothetical protein
MGNITVFLFGDFGRTSKIVHRIKENIDSRNQKSKLAICCSVGECPSCNKRTNVGVTC